MSRTVRSTLAIAIGCLTLALSVAGCGGGAPAPAPHDSVRPTDRVEHAEPARQPSRSFAASIGFHSRRQLSEHFAKHGAEFGAASPREYLAEAQRLRDAPAGGPVLELVREDGVITRFDRDSGAFIAFDEDGTIRTFFKPNLGEQYFRRQARRGGDRR